MSIMGFEPTPLIQAVLDHDSSEVSRLLASGANVNAGDNQGKTALMWAAETGQLDLVEALIEAGANTNARDVFGWTALIAASSEGRTECVRHLLRSGAEVNARDKDGKTALIRARSEEVAELLKAPLAHRGVRPASGTRMESKEAWKQRHREERIRKRQQAAANAALPDGKESVPKKEESRGKAPSPAITKKWWQFWK